MKQLLKAETVGKRIYLTVNNDGKKDIEQYPAFNWIYKYFPDPKGEFTGVDGKKLKKVTYSDMRIEPHLFFMDAYESDINPAIKFARHKFYHGGFDEFTGEGLNIVYFDIENAGSVDTTNTPQPVVSIVCWSSKTKMYTVFCWMDGYKTESVGVDDKVYRRFDNEKDMLEAFAKHVSEADVICGWNINFFDIPYLVMRMQKIGADPNLLSPIHVIRITTGIVDRKANAQKQVAASISGLCVVDLIQVASKLLEWYEERPPNLSLGAVSATVLKDKDTKIQLEESIAKLWQSGNMDTILEYNIKDVELMVKLNDKMNLFDFVFNIKKMSPLCSLDELSYYSKVFDYYFYYKFKDLVFPHKPEFVDKEKLTGGYTMDPAQGIHDNVAIFDFSGLYPNLIRQFNISPDTKDPDGRIKLSTCTFSEAKHGILPKVIDIFYGIRKKYKELMNKHKDNPSLYKKYFILQLAAKTLINSAYGVFGYKKFRLFDSQVVNSVTTTGRELIKSVIDYVDSTGKFKVLYADTDSVFVKILDMDSFDSEKLNEEITAVVDKFCEDHGTTNKYLAMEFETLFTRLILSSAKKKYIGWVSRLKGKACEKKLYYKGIEIVKKDTPVAIRELLKQLFMTLLDDDEYFTQTRKLIVVLKRELKQVPAQDLMIHKNISREIDQYTVMPQHVRAAVYMNDYKGKNFSKQNYSGGMLYVNKNIKPVGAPATDVIFVENVKDAEGYAVNYEKYFDMFVLNKLKTLFGKKFVDSLKYIALSNFFGGKT